MNPKPLLVVLTIAVVPVAAHADGVGATDRSATMARENRLDRIYLEAAAGPSIHFFAKSYWTVEGGAGGDDLEAPAGLGAQAKLAASYLITDAFALGLETRYRYLKTDDLREMDSDTVITGGLLVPESDRTYQLDFSGLSAMLRAQFLVF